MAALIRPDSPDLWRVAAVLVDDYAASLGVPLDFQDFDRERAHLAEEYGPPDGVFLIAQDAGAHVGCGALRRFSDTACEMKRLYVRPSAEGKGTGRLLATTLIAEARRLGYRTMLLDTLPGMARARALYASLGFEPTEPYRFNPVDGTAYLKLNL